MNYRTFALLSFWAVSPVFALSAFAMLPSPEQTQLVAAAAPVPTLQFGAPMTQTTAPAIATGATNTALSANTQDIRTEIGAFLVSTQDGREVLVPITPTTAIPSGAVIEYRAHYTNQSADRIRTMQATIQIPQGAELIGNITPKTALASLDQSRFVRMPIRGNIGGQVQEVPLNLYKALRWELTDIGIGGTAVVQFRVKLAA